MTRYSTVSFLFILQSGSNKITMQPYAALFVIVTTGEHCDFISTLTLFLLTVCFGFKKIIFSKNLVLVQFKDDSLRMEKGIHGAVWEKKKPFFSEGSGLERFSYGHFYEKETTEDTHLWFVFKVVLSETKRFLGPRSVQLRVRTDHGPHVPAEHPELSDGEKRFPRTRSSLLDPTNLLQLKCHQNLYIVLESLFSRTSASQLWSLA